MDNEKVYYNTAPFLFKDYEKEELNDLRYFRQRYFDFWEWFEAQYGQTEKELWDEFEAWEDQQELLENGTSKSK